MFFTALKIFILAFSVILFFTKATDADFLDRESAVGNSLSVTTLDFSARDTVANGNKNLLLRTSGLLPGGFDVASFRIKNDGQTAADYRGSVIFEDGQPLCQSLQLQLYHQEKLIYKGNLRDFAFSSTLKNSQNNDFILTLALSDNNPALQNLSCQFDLLLQTLENGQIKKKGLADSEIISNMITSGTW